MPHGNQKIDDFIQRYQGTWLRLRTAAGTDIYYIKQVDALAVPDAFRIKCLIDDGYLPPVIFAEEDFEIAEAMPTSKYVNTTRKGINFTLYASRIPERQYKRGLCNNTMQYYTPSHQQWNGLEAFVRGLSYSSIPNSAGSGLSVGRDQGWMMASVKFLFDPRYPSFAEACDMMLNMKAWTQAFTQYYCLMHSFKGNELLLCRKNVAIATVKKSSDGQFLITVPNALFKQEIMDLIRRNSISNAIVS